MQPATFYPATTTSTTAGIVNQSVPAHTFVTPHYSIAVGIYSFSLAFITLFALFHLATHQGKRARSDRAMSLLQQQATLERIFQTHYWSEDYRTQDASEDHRSNTVQRQQSDSLRRID